ncbi:MAG: SIMPL domain-containing protein, partial [Desulfuromonadaceae bacterium]|nr:SIMPL domain-containing protein [Desulfuromonadaceae bacterium]
KPIDINTSTLTVYEERNDQINRDGSGKVAKPEMYRINRDVISQIEDITKLDVILDNALKLWTNSIQNVEFYSGNAEEFRFAALAKASDDARKKAEFLANRFGCKVGKVRQIEYDYKGQGPQPQFYGAASAGLRGADSLSFLQGGVDVTATVNVEFEIE